MIADVSGITMLGTSWSPAGVAMIQHNAQLSLINPLEKNPQQSYQKSYSELAAGKVNFRSPEALNFLTTAALSLASCVDGLDPETRFRRLEEKRKKESQYRPLLHITQDHFQEIFLAFSKKVRESFWNNLIAKDGWNLWAALGEARGRLRTWTKEKRFEGIIKYYLAKNFCRRLYYEMEASVFRSLIDWVFGLLDPLTPATHKSLFDFISGTKKNALDSFEHQANLEIGSRPRKFQRSFILKYRKRR